MSIFRAGSKQSAITPDYTGLQIQTAVNALPVPIVWGESKIAPNVIWYNNFQSHTQQSSGGGKGGIFGGGATSGYTYSAAVIMAMCEGPVAGINQIWRGQSIYTLAGLGLSLFTGTTPQTVWSYLTASYPTQALGYQGTAFVCAANYDLSSSATLDNHNFEVQGFFYGSGSNGVDADPAKIVGDFLTNAQYGVGFPNSSIDAATLFGSGGDASFQTYCKAAGLALSSALTNQETASSVLGRWLQLCNTAAVWSGGLLRFIPYGDSTLTGGGATFTPDVTPLYDLTDDDFKADAHEEPLQVSRSDPYQAYNVWRLEVAERNNAYSLTTVESRDQNAVELYGMRIASTVTAHEICDPNVGLISGQLMLQRAVYIRNTYKFRLSWEYCLLDPMDLVTVTDAALGLVNAPVRITEIEEDESGFLQVTAEEFPAGAATATLYATQAIANNPVNRNVAAGAVNPPIIFEPTDELGGGLQVWAAVSSDTSYWGGAFVWSSYEEGGSYANIGTISGPARMGTTTADLPPVPGNATGPTIDQTNTLAVDLTESGGALATATAADALALNTACYVGGEIVAYANATLTATAKYNLTYLLRGAFGTESAIADHPAGTPFARLDSAIFKYGYDQQRIGATIYLKFQSFNVWGGGVQDLSDCPAYPYTITGSALASPLPDVTNLRTVYNNQTGFTDLYWDVVSDFRNGVVYEVRSGSSWQAGITLGTVAHSPFTVPGSGTYWVAARCQPTPGLIVYSETPQDVAISGAVITQNVIFTVDLAAEKWPGQFTGAISIDTNLNAIRTSGAGNILADPNILITPDILNYGNEGTTGGVYYPSGCVLDIGYVANASVSIKYQPTGVPLGQNILAISNILTTPDILGSISAQFITAYPLIETATTEAGDDLYAWGDLYQFEDMYQTSSPEWGSWQKFSPGTYQARWLNFAFFLQTDDPNTEGYNLEFAITITIPARIDQYAVMTSASGTVAVTFRPQGALSSAGFNGGAGTGNLPVVQGTIGNAQAGDQLVISDKTLTGLNVEVLNSGAPIARNVELVVQGY